MCVWANGQPAAWARAEYLVNQRRGTQSVRHKPIDEWLDGRMAVVLVSNHMPFHTPTTKPHNHTSLSLSPSLPLSLSHALNTPQLFERHLSSRTTTEESAIDEEADEEDDAGSVFSMQTSSSASSFHRSRSHLANHRFAHNRRYQSYREDKWLLPNDEVCSPVPPENSGWRWNGG